MADESVIGLYLYSFWRLSKMNELTMFVLVLSLLVLPVQAAQANSNQIIRVPLFRQSTDYTCGVTALQAILAYYGQDVREDILAKTLHAQHSQGTRYRNIADYARLKGFSVEIRKDMSIDHLKATLAKGRPVICLIQAWPDKKTDFKTDWVDGHYVVAVGADDEKVVFMDPSTAGHYAFIPNAEFQERWHDTDGKEKLEHFGMAIWKEGYSFEPDKLEPLN